MVDRIYPAKLQLDKANSFDTEAPFLDLNLSISNGTVSTKIYDKRDNFDIVISRSSMVISLGVPRMECTYLSLFVSLEHLLTKVTSTIVIKPIPPSSLGRAIVIINFVGRFQSFIADTVGWCKNIMLA